MAAFKGWEKGNVTLPDGRTEKSISPIIISASRSTDLPAFFSNWFINRLRAGYMKWINPFKAKQIQYVSFDKTRVFVFWSKNPQPLMRYLDEIDEHGINYYFQYTVNNYEQEGLEPNVPSLQKRIENFRYLSDRIGKERVIWRYDPLILSQTLTEDVLIDRISAIAEQLVGFTQKLVFSFADIKNYRKVQNNLSKVIEYDDFSTERMHTFAQKLTDANTRWGFELATCAEEVALDQYEIKHNHCIDDEVMVRVFNKDTALMNFLGYKPEQPKQLNLFSDSLKPGDQQTESWDYYKDKGQRKTCGCIVSKDIGVYNTCSHFCSYCYANASPAAVKNNMKKHSPEAESLIVR